MKVQKYRAKLVGKDEFVAGWIYEHLPPIQCIAPKDYVPEKSKWYILNTAFADWSMPRNIDFLEVEYDTIEPYDEQ